MSDVWDLTKRENGDHVLIALTRDECRIVVDLLERYDMDHDTEGYRAMQEIERCLRDQKDSDGERV